MIIGINAAAAIKQPRTGVEEYTYQLIKHLTMLPEVGEHRFILFVPGGTNLANSANQSTNYANKIPPNPPLQRGEGGGIFDFSLPENFIIKELNWPLPMWTQIRLAAHLARHKPDILFIPVHVLPFAHPKNSVVAIHGLEYEYFPQMYPWRHLKYLRSSTRYAVKHARKIIAVSESTKRDLVKFYETEESKITVVHHGIIHNSPQPSLSLREGAPPLIVRGGWGELKKPYLLYIGRIELKKNLIGILEAYKILKEKYKIPHELVLAGAPGFGYEKIKFQVSPASPRLGRGRASFKFQVHQPGYVSEAEKQQLLVNADVFLFPSFYEGFGLPILEAQAAGVPVVTSNVSSMPEVTGDSALLADPNDSEQIAQAVYKLIDGSGLRDKLIGSGYENIKRFSWEKCVKETLSVLVECQMR